MTKQSSREGVQHAQRAMAADAGSLQFGRPPGSPTDTAPQRRSNIVKKLHPDQKGTRRLTERFGDRLVCVRYRTDPESGRRFTTVEIVVEERSPTPPEPSHQLVRVGWKETQLRDAIKASGGIWMPDMKLWKVSGSTIRRLKLKKRIVTESA